MTGWTWLFLTVLGAAILGLFIFYGQRTTNKRREEEPRAVQRTEQKTKELYEEEERRPDK